MAGPTPRGGGTPAPESVVDLRSDAVTRPTPPMWEAMTSDALAWSRMGDRTVSVLEERIAAMLGKPSALFVPTGTMANTLALCCWSEPGDFFVADQHAHVLRAEGHAYAQVARVSPVGLTGHRGHPTAQQLRAALAGRVRPSLLWLENTHTFAGGTVAAPEAIAELADVARGSALAVHLDGARLWNAAVATGRSVAELAGPVDSVTVNLDKGLGCPGGAVLCGPPDLIDRARLRKVGLGGVIAQAGLLASCGLVALSDPLQSLGRDHELARLLADGLRRGGLDAGQPETNIVLVRVPDAVELREKLAIQGVLVLVRDRSTLRFVTHRDVDRSGIERAVSAARAAATG